MLKAITLWFDTRPANQDLVAADQGVDWARIIPFLMLHAALLLGYFAGISAIALVIFAASYIIRMFAITAFYHRYFSHKSFKTNRLWQFLFGCLGATATQRGPLWWAANHRNHHIHSDTKLDPHSRKEGFWHSHCGWFLSQKHFSTDTTKIKDLSKYPELVWLDRFDIFMPIAYGMILFALGAALNSFYPGLETSGFQLFYWGFIVSTVALLHATFSINSVCHWIGSRRYKTKDDSRNNWLLAILTLGEGWHNNHHHAPYSARQGFYWWEIDISYAALKGMEKLGIISNLKTVSVEKRDATTRGQP